MADRTSALARTYDTDPEAAFPVRLASEVAACPPHHFIIESPSGTETSRGACKKCGERKEYRNWLEQYEYAGTVWKRTGA